MYMTYCTLVLQHLKTYLNCTCKVKCNFILRQFPTILYHLKLKKIWSISGCFTGNFLLFSCPIKIFYNSLNKNEENGRLNHKYCFYLTCVYLNNIRQFYLLQRNYSEATLVVTSTERAKDFQNNKNLFLFLLLVYQALTKNKELNIHP